jgi:hypothetical protein
LPLWLVICGLGLTQIIGWGTTYYALGALSQDIAQATGWSQSLIFGAFSASLLLNGIISARGGRLIDRAGGRRAMVAGSLFAVMGLGVMGLFPTPAAYVGGWLLLAFAMRFATYDAAFASLTQIAGNGARRAISYLTLFGGLASTFFWPISHALSSSFGWGNTLLIFAALNLFICLPLHWILLRDAKGEFHAARPPYTGAEPLSGGERRKAIALFATAVALNGVVFSAISAHVVPLFEGLGFRGEEAVFMAALIGPSQVASRLGEILMGRRLTPMHLGLLAFGLLPLAVGLFAALGFSWGAALVFALLYGASNGLVTIAKGAVPLSLFGTRGYGEVLGVIATPNLVLNAAAPLLFALLLGWASPQAGLIIAGGCGLASCLAMLVLARMHPLRR